MSFIMELIGPELFKLSNNAIEFGKNAESDFVCTLASTNINHSAPNLVEMYLIKILNEFDYWYCRTRTV